MCVCVCVCVCVCNLTLLLFIFLAIIVICLNTSFLLLFPEPFCSFTCYSDGIFQRKCPPKDIQVLLYIISCLLL